MRPGCSTHQQQEPTCLGVFKQGMHWNKRSCSAHTKNDHTLMCSRQLCVTLPSTASGLTNLASLVSSSTPGGVAPPRFHTSVMLTCAMASELFANDREHCPNSLWTADHCGVVEVSQQLLPINESALDGFQRRDVPPMRRALIGMRRSPCSPTRPPRDTLKETRKSNVHKGGSDLRLPFSRGLPIERSWRSDRAPRAHRLSQPWRWRLGR